ncbi:unnamed protein product [Prunus armeniaca]
MGASQRTGCTFTPSLTCYEAGRLGQGFLYAGKSSLSLQMLLDNVENFIFRLYGTSAETFTFVPFYADVSDTVEVPAAMPQRGQFRKYAMLNVAPIPLPTLGDSRSEISVPYSPYRVKRQFGLDQGVPSSPNHADPFVLHSVFWSNDPIPNSCRPIVLASKRGIGSFSRGYQAYWNRCHASFREFQSLLGDRLPSTTARLVGLVSEEKAILLSQKRNLPFISKSSDIVGEFPKTKPKPGVQNPGGSGKSATPVSSKRKREKEQNVAPSGPPRTKEATPPERPQSSKPAASESRGKMGTTPKRRRSSTPSVSPQATSKSRSMRVLQAKFIGTRTSGSNASGTRTVVTIDDDSDDCDTTESEANTPEQEDMDNIGNMHKGSDGNDNYDHDGDVPFDNYTEQQGGLDTFSGSVGSSMRPVGVEPIGHVAHNMEIVPVVAPSFDTLHRLVEAALVESFPTMLQTNSQDTTSMFRITNPLPPIFQHFLRRDLAPAISPVLPATLRSNTFAFHGTLPVPSHVQPLLRVPEPGPLSLLPSSLLGDANAAKNA